MSRTPTLARKLLVLKGFNTTMKMKNETPLVTVPSRPSLRLAPVLVIAALMAFCPTLMRADTIALSFTSSTGFVGPGSSAITVGYAFTLSSAVTVTQLGLWDQGGNGLIGSHDVTIWTSTGMLLATTTIPSGTGATLTNGFRYVSIASVLLAAGSYTISGDYAVDAFDFAAYNASGITPASGVAYAGGRGRLGSGFPADNSIGNENGYFGPNFQFTEGTGVPDTGSTLSLLGFASLGLVALRRKLRC